MELTQSSCPNELSENQRFHLGQKELCRCSESAGETGNGWVLNPTSDRRGIYHLHSWRLNIEKNSPNVFLETTHQRHIENDMHTHGRCSPNTHHKIIFQAGYTVNNSSSQQQSQHYVFPKLEHLLQPYHGRLQALCGAANVWCNGVNWWEVAYHVVLQALQQKI